MTENQSDISIHKPFNFQRNEKGHFLKGNVIAHLGAENGGRPKIQVNLDKLAEEIIEWSEQIDSYILIDFTSKRRIAAEYLSIWAKEHSGFAQALSIAKQNIGVRREIWNHTGRMDKGCFNRYQGMYDVTIRDHEREEKAYEYSLRNANETMNVRLVQNERPYRSKEQEEEKDAE